MCAGDEFLELVDMLAYSANRVGVQTCAHAHCMLEGIVQVLGRRASHPQTSRKTDDLKALKNVLLWCVLLPAEYLCRQCRSLSARGSVPEG